MFNAIHLNLVKSSPLKNKGTLYLVAAMLGLLTFLLANDLWAQPNYRIIVKDQNEIVVNDLQGVRISFWDENINDWGPWERGLFAGNGTYISENQPGQWVQRWRAAILDDWVNPGENPRELPATVDEYTWYVER